MSNPAAILHNPSRTANPIGYKKLIGFHISIANCYSPRYRGGDVFLDYL
jgi:hypothetical protein